MKFHARTTPIRKQSITKPRRAGQECLPKGKVLSHDWTEADIIALALWLKDGGPANRLEQYRYEVSLQLRAIGAGWGEDCTLNTGFAREDQSQRATSHPISAGLFGST